MIKKLLSIALIFNVVLIDSKIEPLNYEGVQVEGQKIASYNTKVRFVRGMLYYSSMAAVGVGACYLGYQAKDWVEGKQIELAGKPFNSDWVRTVLGVVKKKPVEPDTNFSWDALKQWFSFSSKVTTGELNQRLEPLESVQKRYLENAILNAGITLVIKDYCSPVFVRALTLKSFNWAFDGIDKDFYNCKLAAVNVNPNSAVISEIATIKLDTTVHNSEAALEALNRGAEAQIYIEGVSVSEEALAFKLKAAAAKRLASGNLSKEIQSIFVEAFAVNFQKPLDKIFKFAAVLASQKKLQEAEVVTNLANEFVAAINTGLNSDSDFDLLAHVVAFENSVNSVYNSLQ
jgi:hypothetical protein